MSGDKRRTMKRKGFGGDGASPNKMHQPCHADKEKGHNLKDHYVPMMYQTSSPFPPRVMQKGESFEEIFKMVTDHDMYPRTPVSILERDFVTRLREYTIHGGQCLVSTSLPATCNLKSCRPTPRHVVCDVFLVTPSHPPTVLTFTENTRTRNQEQDVRAYNKSVAKALLFARYFTKERFDVTYGVVTPKAAESAESFSSLLSQLKKDTTAYCIPSNLLMSDHRCREIYKAVIMCTALTGLTKTKTDGTSDCHYVLSLDTYTSLMNNLNSPYRDTIEDKEDEYFISVLAERLSRTGHIVDTTQSSKMRTAKSEESLLQRPSSRNIATHVKQKDGSKPHWERILLKHFSDTHQIELGDLVVYNDVLPCESSDEKCVTVLVADMKSKCIKRINWWQNAESKTFNTKVDSFSIEGEPWGITKLSDKEVLVSLPHEKKLCVVSLLPRLSITRIVETEKKYYGISRHGPGIIVACAPLDSILHLLDSTKFEVIAEMPFHNKKELRKPKFLCKALDDDIIVSDSCANTITKLSLAGEVKFRHSKPVLCPRGVTVDTNGDIYFADLATMKIVQLDSSGNQIQEIGMQGKPTGLCLDYHGRLFVSTKDSIYVLHEQIQKHHSV